MKKLSMFLFFSSLILIACQKENLKSENENSQTQINSKTYFVVMKITLENQRAKMINDRFERFSTKKFETIEHYVSDVKEITQDHPFSEDEKFRELDRYEKQLLNELQNEYFVLDRQIRIFDTYSDASRYRQ